jgi:hypothetical protein
MDKSPSLNKKSVRSSVITPISIKSPFVSNFNIINKISICPCVDADGEHLPTAQIFDKGFNLDPLKNHKPSDFK